MKLTIVAVTALAVPAFTTAAAARTNWQGEAVVTAVNAACTAENENVGAIYKVMFYPSGITDNGADSFLTFYGYRNAFSLKLAAGRPVAGKAYAPIYINSYGKSGAPAAGTISAYAQTPTTITTSTAFITMTLQVTNWGATTGCTATLEAAFVRRR